jgi:hypothetical protein
MSQNPTPSSLDLVLSATHGQLLAPLSRACEIAGFSPKTYRNKESAGKVLPFPATPGHRRVDVRDLAAYLDSLRACSSPPSTPTQANEMAPAPRRPGRPTKIEQQQRQSKEGSSK